MGWDSHQNWETKKDVVNYCVKNNEYNGRKVLAHKSTGQGWYGVVECPEYGRFLVCTMIRKTKGEFWKKDMSEEMGPSMDDCPVSLFELVGKAPNEYAENFRANCEKRQAKKSWTPEQGQRVKVFGKEYIVCEKYNRVSYMIRSVENGHIYKTPKANMEAL